MTISASPSSQARFRPCERAGNAHNTHIHALRFSIITAPSYQTQETQQPLFCPLLPRFKTRLDALFNQQIAKSKAINNKTKTKHYKKSLKHILIQHILLNRPLTQARFNQDIFYRNFFCLQSLHFFTFSHFLLYKRIFYIIIRLT